MDELQTRTLPLGATGAYDISLGRRVTLLIFHREGMEAVPLDEGQAVTIGRAKPADVCIPHPSLSAVHARFELDEEAVWVEDLGSTNGTRVDDEQVTRSRVTAGQEVLLGSIAVALHVLAPSEATPRGLIGHEAFLVHLRDEIVRHATFGRQLGVVLVRGSGEVRRWCPALQKQLRPVDRVALYGPSAVEITFPEVSAEALQASLEALSGRDEKLRFGAALYPDAATSADELLEAARTAAQQATAARPIQLASLSTHTQEAVATVVQSPAMQEVYDSVQRLGRASIPVLICGETGAGKEVVARAIHDAGPRHNKPMRCLNCAAIPSQLIESTLFGHEKGAFTGADRRANGLFLEADGGTLLLDEIGELSPGAQATLLRVLETKRVSRVGSADEIEVDVRVLAATNRNLEAMCEAGEFRWDLLYRINTMTLRVPPLRERKQEVEPLARLFLEEANEANGCRVAGIEEEALELLRGYGWPGNVRELRNVIHRAAVMAQGDKIAGGDLPGNLRGARRAPPTGADADDDDGSLDFKERVQRFETRLITRALSQAGWNQTEAAKLLRIPIRTLGHKIRSYNISRPE